MNAPRSILLIGAERALIGALTAALQARGYQLTATSDVRGAAQRLGGAAFAAVIVDFESVPPVDREALSRFHKERGGFALFGLEAAASLSPAQATPLRRLSWPLPAGFLDQVRAAEVPIMFLVEPSLFLTQGVQSALRQAGVLSFQIDGSVGAVEMMREQAARAEEARAKPKPAGGFWERLFGGARVERAAAVLGRVAVVQFPGGESEAGQFDERLRAALPRAACYSVTTTGPLRAAAAAVAARRLALLPRENAARIAGILADALNADKSAPREKERLLLCDNDVPMLSRLAEALIALGYEVDAAVTGQEAVALAQRKHFHLAAIGGSALEATKLSGANLALKLRERDKNLRLILMVDQFPVQDALKGVSRAVELGLDDAILKPVDASRLVLSIQRALERGFLLRENARLLKEVQESARRLAEVNGFQTKFFATVAHDVKNPLTAILGYAEVLSMRLKDQAEALSCAAHIHNAAQTLSLLVSDLVDLAAIESGKLRVEIGSLDLEQVITDVKSRVDVVAQRKRLNFAVNIPQHLPRLRGDSHRIGQVIQNLCTNAVQYTPEGGSITIEAAPGPDGVIVGVRDTGIGISKEDLPRVWERFFQTKEAQEMRRAGLGLGLKIAREIVQMHGGEMGIESKRGVGSFFFFKLPLPKP